MIWDDMCLIEKTKFLHETCVYTMLKIEFKNTKAFRQAQIFCLSKQWCSWSMLNKVIRFWAVTYLPPLKESRPEIQIRARVNKWKNNRYGHEKHKELYLLINTWG
jgi:hypothetical protein